MKIDETKQKIENSTVAFFVNPSKGTEHGLKLIESKIRKRIYILLKSSKFHAQPKKFEVKINLSFDFVFLQLPDLPKE